MHRMLPTVVPAAVVLASASACLFSTTPPKPRSDAENPPPDPNTAIVVGQVLHFGLVDRTYRRTPNRGVHVLELGSDRNGDGQLDVLGRQNVTSDRYGTYRAVIRWPDLQAIELKAFQCSYDPANSDLECCFDIPPCPPSICNIWTTPRRYTLHIGQTLQQEIIVPCAQIE